MGMEKALVAYGTIALGLLWLKFIIGLFWCGLYIFYSINSVKLRIMSQILLINIILLLKEIQIHSLIINLIFKD